MKTWTTLRRIEVWKAIVLFCATVLLCAMAGPVRAEEPAAAGAAGLASAAELARALKQGAAAAARGDHAGCVEAYSKAVRIAPEGATVGRLGLCEEALGHDILAYTLLRLAQESEPPPARGGGQGLWKRFEEAVVRLERRVARAIVVTTPKDAEVFLDGVSLGSKLSGRYITVTPGEHTWRAIGEGHKPATFTHTARAGDMPDVRLYCEPLEGEKPPNPATVPCDEACRAKLLKSAADATNFKWELKFERDLDRRTRQVQSRLELIYGEKVDPSFALIGGFLASVGLTADPGPGFFLGGEARWGAFNEVGFSAGVETRALFPTKVVTLASGNPLDVSMVTAALVPCVRYKWVSGCAVADIGILIAGGPSPIDFDVGPVTLTAGFGPRLGFQFPFAEQFMVRGFAELRITPLDSGYDVGVLSPRSWTIPTVSGLFGVGFSFGNPVRQVP